MIFPVLRAVRARGPALARQMASAPTAEELGLKGWEVYFNAFTTAGRRNIVLGTYGVVFGAYFLNKMRKPKEVKPDEAAQ